jgi:hypothetical protein
VQDNVGVGAYEQAVIAIVDGLVRVAPKSFHRGSGGPAADVISVLAQPPRVIVGVDNPFNFLRDDFLAIQLALSLFCWDQAYLAPWRRRATASLSSAFARIRVFGRRRDGL